jgi:tripartite-type tricarboxylate transporter receptor subunit TctC
MTISTSKTLAILAACAAMFAGAAFAQPYPNKPIKYVVPFPAGGTTDTLARIISTKLTDALGQPVIIENRGGAGGNIGSDVVAKSAPDGYTILGGTISSHAINVSLYANMPYDPVRDFVPITLIGTNANVLIVHPSNPANSVAELIAYAKANPGKVAFASAGSGTSQHLSGELFKSLAKIDITHIPYKGSAPAITDLMGGQVTMMFDTLIVAAPQIKAGKVKALAVTSSKRVAGFDQIPTMIEGGVAGYEVVSWQGIFAPAKTPPEIVRRLNTEIVKIINMPDVRERFAGLGLEPAGNSSEDFAAFQKAEIAKWAKVVKEGGVKVD